ncbi:MAG: MBL fold metallo-hydrolase [Campylobacteraceae bacterium]|nr:MBL fold metallo-hydrolase [Campylobacteraceae bacterium]
MATCCSKADINYDSTQFIKGKFRNVIRRKKSSLKDTMSILWDVAFNKAKVSFPTDKHAIPVIKLKTKDLEDMKNNSVIRLGHSSLVLKLENELYLTDPVFSNRASPFSWFGPKRFHQPPLSAQDLPKIKAVIISHNHYDHLDSECITTIKDKVERFYVPLGVSSYLIKYGVEKDKIVELDWWQSFEANGISFTATPAQHFSGRSMFDFDKSLWCSWVIKTPNVNLFFSGDTGYFDGFKEIGDKYGPFDMTFVEAGAYNKRWMDVHMMPEQTVNAHTDLQGKVLFPIHNGTFDLSLHSWYEPFDRIYKLSINKDISSVFPKMGENIDILGSYKTNKWW